MFEVKDLQKFFDESESHKIGFKGLCHVCGEPVCLDMDMDFAGKVIVTGGALYQAQVGCTAEDMAFFVKCDACFKKSSTLKNFQPCEVYSRVIGYLRPVSQWNEGKQEEFKVRSKFRI